MPFIKGQIGYWINKKRPELKNTGSSKTMFKKGEHPSIKTEFKKGEHRNPTMEFKKGEHKSIETEFGNKPAWNKGKKGRLPNHNLEGLKKGWGWWKGKKRLELSGKNHPFWKGGKENTSLLKKKRRAQEKGAEGAHTLEEWNTLKAKFNYSCAKCRKQVELTEDYIIPLSKGGSHYISNIQPLCRKCNSIKQDRLEGTF